MKISITLPDQRELSRTVWVFNVDAEGTEVRMTLESYSVQDRLSLRHKWRDSGVWRSTGFPRGIHEVPLDKRLPAPSSVPGHVRTLALRHLTESVVWTDL